MSLNASWAIIWLPVTSASENGGYFHKLLQEDFVSRANTLPYIKSYVSNAHEDAINRLRKIEGISLHPDGIDAGQDPAKNYPQGFTSNTLMGYFGEILAALVCENFTPFGLDGWKVPAFLFRYHLEEFRHLEQIRQNKCSSNPKKENRWGRTGDDCVAFILGDDGHIHKTLFCEAKCYSQYDHDATVKAFEKLNTDFLQPLDRQQIIEVLLDSECPDKERWITALQKMRFTKPLDYERCDIIVYTYGQKPRSPHLPTEKPGPEYTQARRLQTIEIYLKDVQSLVLNEIYNKTGE